MCSSEAYWHVGAVLEEVRQVLTQVNGFVAAGEGRNALAILEAITERYVADWVELDDPDGRASAFFKDLGAVQTEAILTADWTIRMACQQVKSIMNQGKAAVLPSRCAVAKRDLKESA
jgi:hypothetical protein